MSACILLVEDDMDFAEGLADILELEGHTVVISSSGEQALNSFAEQPFHLVLADLQLPGMSGVECVRALRNIDQEVIMFIITGYAAPTLMDEAQQAGAVGVLEKPVNRTALLELVARAGK